MASPSPFRVILIDGNALLHRFWHALPPLTAPDGRIVNAVYGFALAIEHLLQKYHPTHLAAAWDLPKKTFRHELHDAYKAQRVQKEPELYAQIPWVQELLAAYGVKSVSVEGFEADDVIGTLSWMAEEAGYTAGIVTGDMDTLQLVSDQVSVMSPQKGTKEFFVYTPSAVVAKYGLMPSQWIDYKTLLGDPSDNLKGVEGIGQKTAQSLLQTYQSIPGILEAVAAGKVGGKMGERLAAADETIALMRRLVTIVRDVPLPVDMAAIELPPLNHAAVSEALQSLGFRSLVKAHQWVAAPPIDPPKRNDDPPSLAVNSETPKEPAAATPTELVKHTREDLSRLGGTTLILAPLSSVSSYNDPEDVWLVSDGDVDLFCAADALKAFEELWWKERSLLVVDAKRLLHLISSLADHPRVEDWLLLAYLRFPGLPAYDVGVISQQLLLPPKSTLGATIRETADRLTTDLKEQKLFHLYESLEKPLIPVLLAMENRGIRLDVERMRELSKQLAQEIRELESKMKTVAGAEFNPNSPSQLAEVLFEKLSLPTKGIKKTKTGFSTAASELEKLDGKHPIIDQMLEYRERTKLQSTYVEVLPTLCDEHGRIHTTFNQTIAVTGRLSSTDPNLQNIPIKTALGQEIRKAFVTEKGWKLVSADFSQIELRLAAIIANDEPFLAAFREGADIHTRTAAEMFGRLESEVGPDERRAAKAINFGILYGMGARSLARSTGKTTKEAEQILERYFEVHHAIRRYMDEAIEQARRTGYVETLFGRRRYLPDIHSHLPMLRAQAERMAINMPMQGTQADLLKQAMLKVHEELKTRSDAHLLLQVHDELVLEVKADQVLEVARLVERCMSSVKTFSIPLAVQVKQGDNWGEMMALELC